MSLKILTQKDNSFSFDATIMIFVPMRGDTHRGFLLFYYGHEPRLSAENYKRKSLLFEHKQRRNLKKGTLTTTFSFENNTLVFVKYCLISNQKQGLISNRHKVVMPIPRLNPLPF
jgi:hypothetical protein